MTHFTKLNITIRGNNNTIFIGSCSSGSGLSICIEDDNNRVVLGNHFTVGPNTELAAIEELLLNLETIVCFQRILL